MRRFIPLSRNVAATWLVKNRCVHRETSKEGMVVGVYDTGSTAFMMICTMLVLLMTPGLSFFYGGLSRRKNVVNTMIMVMSIIGIVGVM